MIVRMSKKLVTIWLPAIALVFFTSPGFAAGHMEKEAAQAEPEPVAKIKLKQWKVGFILGGGGGKGKLLYEGEEHRLSINGLRVGAVIGVARTDLEGDVYHMTKLEDIEGIYHAAEAAIAVTGGGKVWALKNSKGVVLKLEGKQLGIELAVDYGGMSVKLRDKEKDKDEG